MSSLNFFDFFDFLDKSSIIIMDGGMGTLLAERGFEPPALPEEMCFTSPDAVLAVHKAYIDAGAQIIETNTFGGSAIKLAERGLQGQTREICRTAAAIAKNATSGGEKNILIAGSIGPTGRLVYPLGELSMSEAIAAFRPQAEGLAEGGADFFLVETMIDIKEAKAAVLACKDASPNTPFAVSFTFESGGATVTGTTPEAAAVWAESIGAAAVGANCGTGPDEYCEVIRRMRMSSSLPILAYPNAGVPSAGEYLSPEDFAQKCLKLAKCGANIIGGCCGSTPAHIARLSEILSGFEAIPRGDRSSTVRFSSRFEVREAGAALPLLVIGERINTSRKSPLREEIRSYDYTTVRKEAREQAASGADLIDINVGLPEIDAKKAMREAVCAVESACTLPISIDSDDAHVLEEGLREVCGVALINSVTCKAASLQRGIELALRYGAVLTVLTIDEAGIPASSEARVALAKMAIEKAGNAGLSKERILIDALTLTLGADVHNGLKTCDAVREIGAWGGHTTLGISNISHGLPSRAGMNRAFLTMAMLSGLEAVICDPKDSEMQDAIITTDALRARDKNLKKYLLKKGVQGTPSPVGGKGAAPPELISSIIEGDKSNAKKSAIALIKAGTASNEIISSLVIPALEKVGKLYESGEYFLPQLIESAQAAGEVCAYLDGLSIGAAQNKQTIIIATVEGDLHDLGKNVVAMVLRSHGYRVVDLGKNVAADVIIKKAAEEDARIIALSALMTSTAPRMKDVIALARERGCKAKIIIGGAVVSEEFSHSIGADGTASDAVSAARLVEKLLRD